MMRRARLNYAGLPAASTRPKAVRRGRDWLPVLYFGLLFILPLWPDFAELKFGGLPNLAPTRLLRAALIAFVLCALFVDRERTALLAQRLRRNWVPLLMLGLLYAVRLASGFIGHFPAVQVFAFVKNDLWSYLSMVLLTLFVVRDHRDITRVIEVTVAAAVIVGMAALIEFKLKHNLFERFIVVTSDYLMNVLADKSRDNFYRVQSTFEHPLLLGQFYVMILPWCWYCFRYSTRRLMRIAGVLAGMLGVLAIYLSGSRAAFGLAVPLVALMFIWEVWRWMRRISNRPAQYLVLLQIPMLLVGFVATLLVLKEITAGNTQTTRGSASIRLAMLNAGLPEVAKAPLIGHGLGEATTVVKFANKSGILTLDNYYLVLALDSGLIALALTVALWVYFLLAALNRSRHPQTALARLGLMLALPILGYIIIMGVHSLQSLTWLLLVLFACVLVLREPQDRAA